MNDLEGLDVPELTEVRELPQFDVGALSADLVGKIDDDFSSVKVQQFEGGQSNPTYKLDTGKRQYVWRKKPPG